MLRFIELSYLTKLCACEQQLWPVYLKLAIALIFKLYMMNIVIWLDFGVPNYEINCIQGFFQELAFDDRAVKTFVEFRIC